jgi:hypothetical protein
MTLTISLAPTSWTKSFAEITFELSAQLLSEIPPLATCFRHAARRHHAPIIEVARSRWNANAGDLEANQE